MTVPLYNLTDTWNNGATVFTAILMNVTDSASDAASLLMDLRVGGTSAFKLAKLGTLTVNRVTDTVTDDLAVFQNGSGSLRVLRYGGLTASSGARAIFSSYSFQGNDGLLDGTGFQMLNTGVLAWSNTNTHYYDTPQTIIALDASGILAQRNGVNAQSFRFFETYTDVANNSMLRLDACKTTAGAHRIMSEANGTGTLRIIALDGFSKAGAAANTDLPSGTWALVHDTSGATTKLVYNDGGTLRTVALV